MTTTETFNRAIEILRGLMDEHLKAGRVNEAHALSCAIQILAYEQDCDDAKCGRCGTLEPACVMKMNRQGFDYVCELCNDEM